MEKSMRNSEEINQTLKIQAKDTVQKLLSSKRFLCLAILYTLSFIIFPLSFLVYIKSFNTLLLLFPSLILFSLWKIYFDMRISPKYYSIGLILLKVIFYVIFLIVSIATVFYIYQLANISTAEDFSFDMGIPFSIILLVLLCIVFFSLAGAIDNIIYSLRTGSRNTSKYTVASGILIIAGFSSILIFLEYKSLNIPKEVLDIFYNIDENLLLIYLMATISTTLICLYTAYILNVIHNGILSVSKE